MKLLEYPFDASYLLSHKRQIKKELVRSETLFIEKKVAILGGSTTANITQMLELFLLNYGIKASFYESEYGRYYEEAVFSNDRLEEFNPDVLYIHTSNRNVTACPQLSDSDDAIECMLSAEMEKFTSIWDKLNQNYSCPIIQNNFELPLYRLLGNRDAADIHGMVNFLTRLNMKFYEYAQTHENFYICDINYIAADYGLKEWSDPFYWYMYKYALNISAIPYLAFNVANIIKSIFGKNKKGFVLDLDNTLWGGVIGDEGTENVRLGPETAEGQVYSEFQRYIKAHKQLGIVLSINSKNDKENAFAGLNHPDSELHPDDFAEIKANWQTKDENLKVIAKELNLLPESLVFIDDNPAERFIVTERLQGVSVPEIGESHQFIQNIDRNGFFETTVLSDDDLRRSAMYKENAERLKLQEAFSDYGEYLRSLEMKAVIKPFESMYMARITQLVNKSNQFNLTVKRYTQMELESVAEDSSYIALYGKLRDRFGDNGVVSVMIGRLTGDICHIELCLMSCRVLKRQMEEAMMDEFISCCNSRNIKEIRGYYHAAPKNKMVKDFYRDMGYKMILDNGDSTVWMLNLRNFYTCKNKYIQVEGS